MVALARRSPRARLYSLVPRSSQCPSIRRRSLVFALSQAASHSRICASSGRIAYLSKSKWMSFRSGTAPNSRGAGRLPMGPASPARLADVGPSGRVAGRAEDMLVDGYAAVAPVDGGGDAMIVTGLLAQPKTTIATATTITLTSPCLMIGAPFRYRRGRHHPRLTLSRSVRAREHSG